MKPKFIATRMGDGPINVTFYDKKYMKNENMLNDEQAEVVREMIIKSMRDVYVDAGKLPSKGFYESSDKLADKILKNVQMSLLAKKVIKKISKLEKSKSKRKIKIGNR